MLLRNLSRTDVPTLSKGTLPLLVAEIPRVNYRVLVPLHSMVETVFVYWLGAAPPMRTGIGKEGTSLRMFGDVLPDCWV